ncbi:MAG: ECF-type sigma factor [Acidobacteriota bacterium]
MAHDVTRWIERLRAGEQGALDELVPRLYDELRSMARHRMRGERRQVTLGTTVLVHEAYMKLRQQRKIDSADRAQFLAVAGVTMRRILVDAARARRRDKRGGDAEAVPLEDVEPFLGDAEAEELLALDDALERLAVIHPRGAEVVSHRFFTGLTLDESAEVLGVSTKTVQRDWLTARAWLRKEVALDLAVTDGDADRVDDP